MAAGAHLPRAQNRPASQDPRLRGGVGAAPLTWVQVCHAVVTVPRGCAVVARHRFPEGLSRTTWPGAVCLVFSPPPLVQEAGGHELHTLLLTLFIWGTGQHTAWFWVCRGPPVRSQAPPEPRTPQFLPGEEGGQQGCRLWSEKMQGRAGPRALNPQPQPSSRKPLVCQLGPHTAWWGSVGPGPMAQSSG